MEIVSLPPVAAAEPVVYPGHPGECLGGGGGGGGGGMYVTLDHRKRALTDIDACGKITSPRNPS